MTTIEKLRLGDQIQAENDRRVSEFKIGNATVRMHGTPDREKIEAATVTLIKKARQCKKRKEKAS